MKSVYLEARGIKGLDKDEEVNNLHDMMCKELMTKFSEAMTKDRMYKNAPAFINEGMIWMFRPLSHYFVEQVLHFSHKDFLIAVEDDLPPMISYVGLWVLSNWSARAELAKDKDLKKRIKTASDIISKIIDKGMEYFEKESKYHLMNKFSPKKLPEKALSRVEVDF